jgi:hypothetical protein
MINSEFKPLHRFFHGDPIEGMANMYSTSVGDTWLYFHNNALVGVCHLEITKDEKDQFYILRDAAKAAKEAMKNEITDSTFEFVSIDELVGHALRLTAAEISDMIQQRLIDNKDE